MRVCGLREAVRLASLLVLVIIVIVVDFLRSVDVLPRLHVRKAKVDTLVDTGIVCSGVRPLLKRAPRDLTSLYAVAYPWLVRDGGLGARNCEGLVKVKGVTT